MKGNCITRNKNKRIVFQETRSKILFNNPKQLSTTQVKVDGCEITDGVRCDFLLIVNNKEFFIELKGQDIEHAIVQLTRSIQTLGTNNNKTAFIICTRSPMSSAKIQNLRIKFRKRLNSKLIVKSSPYTHNI